MLVHFIKRLSKKSKKIRLLKHSDIKLDFLIKESLLQDKNNNSNNIESNYSTLIEEDLSVVDISNREASHFYEFYKILSQENYDLGKMVSAFVEEFKIKNKNIETSFKLVPVQMKEIVKLIEDCVNSFNCSFNIGNPKAEKRLQYCRPAVEKFVFNKLYSILFELYSRKYEKENNVFLERQKIIKEKANIQQILEFLELRKDFRGVNNEDNFQMSPFISVVDCINKLEFEKTPKDKFDTIMHASLELRSCILDITKGRVKVLNYYLV